MQSALCGDDPYLERRRSACVRFVRGWLRRHELAEVLTLTSYGGMGGGGLPDRAYDKVASESDLWRVLESLPQLHREACRASRTVARERGWFRQVELWMRDRVGMEWLAWMDEVEQRTVKGRPFEILLDESAELLADRLGQGWW